MRKRKDEASSEPEAQAAEPAPETEPQTAEGADPGEPTEVPADGTEAEIEGDPAATEEAPLEPGDEDEPTEADEVEDVEPESFDLIGADGRKVLRRVSRKWAEDEKTRISALTGEAFEIEPAAPFYNTSPDEPS